jgi:hypothetical protein
VRGVAQRLRGERDGQRERQPEQRGDEPEHRGDGRAERVAVRGSTPAGSAAANRAVITAPIAATPVLAPIWRRNATAEVAAPRSRCSAPFCATSTITCMTMPMPSPTSSRAASTSGSGVAGPIVPSSARPAAATAVPAIGNGL